MNYLSRRIQANFDKFIALLFQFITADRSHAYITRFALTFLDTWQAIIILNHNYWIPQLVDITTPIYIYSIFSVMLAICAVIALVFSNMLWFSAIVLAINWFLYMFLGIAGLWYSNPPRASSGFSFFVMFISLAAFWRVFLLLVRDRINRTS